MLQLLELILELRLRVQRVQQERRVRQVLEREPQEQQELRVRQEVRER